MFDLDSITLLDEIPTGSDGDVRVVETHEEEYITIIFKDDKWVVLTIDDDELVDRIKMMITSVGIEVEEAEINYHFDTVRRNERYVIAWLMGVSNE